MKAHIATAAVVLLLAGCPEAPAPFTLLQANVGNSLLACQDGYIFKLCELEVENAIRDNIATLAPDVIAFQEILPSCEGIVEDDPRFVCHPDNASEPSQLVRLLGDAYETACDQRNGFECIAVKLDGRAQLEEGYTSAPPVESDADENCDDGFTVGAARVLVGGTLVQLVNGHPQSGFIGRCRRKQLEQALDLVVEPSLLSGDWNLDPFKDTDESADLWVENVGLLEEGKRFHYHSGPAEKNPPFATTENVLFTGTLDHVAGSAGLAGTCTTLGEAEGSARLDGADGANGCDHRALLCTLEAPPSPGTTE